MASSTGGGIVGHDVTADVVSYVQPRVDGRSVCDASVNPVGGTWGACGAD